MVGVRSLDEYGLSHLACNLAKSELNWYSMSLTTRRKHGYSYKEHWSTGKRSSMRMSSTKKCRATILISYLAHQLAGNRSIRATGGKFFRVGTPIFRAEHSRDLVEIARILRAKVLLSPIILPRWKFGDLARVKNKYR